MVVAENLFGIRLVSRRKIAEAGSVGLFETVLKIVKAPSEDTSFVRISYQRLLPSKGLLPSKAEDRYISVREAHERTGISKGKLRRLCRSGKVDARKDKGKWLIPQDSLSRYLEEYEAS